MVIDADAYTKNIYRHFSYRRLFRPEIDEWSNKLFDEFIEGKKIAVISDVTTSELDEAPEKIKNRIDDIPSEYIMKIDIDDEIKDLASKYIEYNAISIKYLDDATHISAATINKVDILVSWNFKHIVNSRRIDLYNSVNLKFGYPIINIRTPREVLDEETEDI
ncbi:MAG: PIN domain protein [bacterium]